MKGLLLHCRLPWNDFLDLMMDWRYFYITFYLCNTTSVSGSSFGGLEGFFLQNFTLLLLLLLFPMSTVDGLLIGNSATHASPSDGNTLELPIDKHHPTPPQWNVNLINPSPNTAIESSHIHLQKMIIYHSYPRRVSSHKHITRLVHINSNVRVSQ